MPVVDPPQPLPQKFVDQLLAGQSAAAYFPRPPGGQRLAPVEKASLVTLAWRASDPNGDELRYELSYAREDDPSVPQTVLASDLDLPVYSFDTAGWPDGRYVFRVRVSDRISRPFEALEDEATSEPVTFDTTPPRILTPRTENGIVSFIVEDATSLLAEVTVSTNGLDFVPILPEDGVLDMDRERFQYNAPRDLPVFIRATDEMGNEASAHRPPSR
jgi:hypothetical protein